MTGRNLPKQLTTLKDKYNDELDASAKSIISMKRKQQKHFDDAETSSETLERGRRRKFRYFVASLGLTVAAVNCYAQATFCIAIVEMVLPADYVFKGESGSQTVKVVPESNFLPNINNSSPSNLAIATTATTTTTVGESIEELSCPLEYKYRDYYDEWRFPPNASMSSSSSSSPPQTLTSLLAKVQVPVSAGPSSHLIDISNRFDWDASRQGLLLGAFAMGMAPLQILGGRLAEIYGAKWVLLAGCVGTALTNLTIPVLAHFSYTLLVVNRVVMGIAQAGMEPALMCLMAQWLAPAETGFFISMLLFALCIGFFLGSLLSSFLLTIGLGWALTYYVTGGLNLIVSILWLVYASKGPQESGLISAEELAYIRHEQQQERARAALLETSVANNDLATTTTIQDISIASNLEASNKHQQQGDAPWMNILRTPSVWAFIICKISVRWCADVLTIELPTYLANVLHLSIKLNGILNSLSSAFFAIFSFITGYFVNELLKRTHEGVANELERTGSNRNKRPSVMSKTTLRKLFQSVASFGSALSIFLMTRYDCNIQLSMSMMFVMSACLMMGTGGELQIPYDMTSRYPGTLHGMACTLSVSGWLAPPLIGLILGDQPSSRHRWSIVWYLTASINLLGGLVFVLFADASPRNFDKGAPSKKAPAPQHPHPPPSNGNTATDNNGQERKRQRERQQQNNKVDASSTCSSESSTTVTVVDLSPSQVGYGGGGGCSLAPFLVAPRPSAAASSCSFDGGELLKIRQLEGSLLSPSSRLDSLLAGQLTDMMFPYQQQQQQHEEVRATAAAQTTGQRTKKKKKKKKGLNAAADNGSGLLAWLYAGTRRPQRQRQRQSASRQQKPMEPPQANGHLLCQGQQHFSNSLAAVGEGEEQDDRRSKIITRL